MRTAAPIPQPLGESFSVAAARASGVSPSRLRRSDLERPFRGVRSIRRPASGEPDDDPFARAREASRRRVRQFLPRMRDGEFITHASAAHEYGAPLPLSDDERVHVGVFRPRAASVAKGVAGHRLGPGMASVVTAGGFLLASPASVWALLGAELTMLELVMLGDYLCRVWRVGYHRPNAGRRPLATIEQLTAAAAVGQRRGAARLRDALALIRSDSWSPRESLTRCLLSAGGCPEPVLNADYVDAHGRFLACIDISYPRFKVAVEYQGFLHASQYAKDVERLERLRADGWIVVQVTAELIANPAELVGRVRAALVARGWRG